MKLRTCLAAIALFMTAAVMNLVLATATKAVSLVVMATNATAIPGEKVFTIGIQIRQADLTAPGTGVNPVLTMQDVTFAGMRQRAYSSNRRREPAGYSGRANELYQSRGSRRATRYARQQW